MGITLPRNTTVLGTDLGAVFLVDLASFHGFVATVTAIVCTAFNIVFVVAIAVALVLRKFTSWLTQVFGVDAFALQNKYMQWFGLAQ